MEQLHGAGECSVLEYQRLRRRDLRAVESGDRRALCRVGLPGKLAIRWFDIEADQVPGLDGLGYREAAYTPVQQVTLSGVSTNWHTLQLSCQDNQLTVSYDGAQVLSAADAEPSPHSSGAIGFDMYTYSTPYTLSVDNVDAVAASSAANS